MRTQIPTIEEGQDRLVELLVNLAEAIDSDPNAVLFEGLEAGDTAA